MFSADPNGSADHPKNENYIFQSLNHVDINLKPWFLIKSGYYIVPSLSTALIFIIDLNPLWHMQLHFSMSANHKNRCLMLLLGGKTGFKNSCCYMIRIDNILSSYWNTKKSIIWTHLNEYQKNPMYINIFHDPLNQLYLKIDCTIKICMCLTLTLIDLIKVAQWKNGSLKKPHHTANLIFFSCHTVLLSFSVTRSQLSQCYAVRNLVVFLTQTKTKAQLSILGRENSNLLYCEVFL